MEGLPTKYPMKDRIHRKDYWVCPRGTLHHDPHRTTLDTYHLKPGQLLHMDFYFLDRPSIRGFTLVLMILDTKPRKMWQLGTPQKRPPSDIITFLLSQL